MKAFCLGFALILSSLASAADITLLVPTIAAIDPAIPATCSWTRYKAALARVSGFDATGNFVLGTADSVAVCGHSGRGSNIHYYHYCANFAWDLSGNLVTTTIGSCSEVDARATYSNAGGYMAFTVVVPYPPQYNYWLNEYENPTLTTP
jgi:hypothetical protein